MITHPFEKLSAPDTGQLLYFRCPSTDPVRNLKLENLLFRHLRQGLFLMLWRNDPCVIIGRNQEASAEVNLSACAHGIRVIRRLSGGGAVYHDHGTVNYTFFTDCPADGTLSFGKLAEPVVSALRSLGLPVSFGGRNDLIVPDGRKVCGTAARIEDGRILSHGCICFSTAPGTIAEYLTPDSGKLARHRVPSVRNRVACLNEWMPGVTPEQFLMRLEEALLRDRPAVPYIPDEALIRELGESSCGIEAIL